MALLTLLLLLLLLLLITAAVPAEQRLLTADVPEPRILDAVPEPRLHLDDAHGDELLAADAPPEPEMAPVFPGVAWWWALVAAGAAVVIFALYFAGKAAIQRFAAK